jgi:hypothetical protein
MPELQPVTTMVFPLRSMPSVTCSAAAAAPNELRGASCAATSYVSGQGEQRALLDEAATIDGHRRAPKEAPVLNRGP